MGSLNPGTARSHPAYTTLASRPDVQARAFSAVEELCAIFKTLTAPIGKDHLAISAALKLSFPPSVADPIPHIRTAWAATRMHHPHLGSVLNPQDPANGKSSSAGQTILIPTFDAEEWLTNTFSVDTGSSNASVRFKASKNEDYAQCIWIPSSSEVLFQTSHWRFDGNAMITIAVNFLNVLTQSLARGADAQLDSYTSPVGDGSIAPGADWILDAFNDEESTPAYMRKAADTMFSDMMAGAPSVALPVRKGSDHSAPGDSLRVSLNFGKGKTSQLLASCKSKGITLALATHAALILCSARYPQHPLCKSYGRFAPVDIRKEFPPPYNTPQYSIGEFCAAFPVVVLDVVGENKSFHQVCAELQRSYNGAKQLGFTDDEGRAVSTAKLGAAFIRRVIGLVHAEVPPDMPTTQAVDFSSLGLVEKVLDREYSVADGQLREKVTVEDFWLSTQTIAKAVQCHGWTFRDEFVLQASWNESYYDTAFMAKFLDEVREQLFSGLGI
ncbi:hypothetical protein PISL3812_02617 [Talaromyces islandicus]|uniref:Uncharacterized protein n=1 Tax=Talaromyces islandicus TaxID=28573 RepID=A0A0U1LS50_TALIS|nr:hypothetical protein PISL3812_02617 [Talaromyces islandicus]